MYVCLCNGVNDKKFVRLCANSILSLFNNCENLFPLEINAVSASVRRARLWKMN